MSGTQEDVVSKSVKIKVEAPKPRNILVLQMIQNPRRNTSHGDRRKEDSRRACRGRLEWR